MTTCEEIQKILENPELETLTFELKSSEILKTNGWKDKFAKEFVAFANKIGGKLIIGIKNDGTFNGKIDYDIDKLKGDINNILKDKISPIIDYRFEFIQCKLGDISIINIKRKKSIPHAYIAKRKSHEIINRAYYIRTPYGIQLVTNEELDDLFNRKLNHKLMDQFEPKAIAKPDITLIREYLKMIRESPLSPLNLVPMLNRIHTEFMKISNKDDMSEAELDIIKDYTTTINNFTLGTRPHVLKIVSGTIRLFVLNPNLVNLTKEIIYTNFEVLYDIGHKTNDICLILYQCGKFESLPKEIYKAIDEKDTDLLKMFRSVLYSIKNIDDKFLFIKKLRLKNENLDKISDINLIEIISTIINYLETYNQSN